MARHKIDRNRPDIRFAMAHGWEYCGKAGNSHLLFHREGSKLKLTLPSTPSDPRSIANNISWIKRITPRED